MRIVMVEAAGGPADQKFSKRRLVPTGLSRPVLPVLFGRRS